MKKIFCILASVLMVLLLASCGGSNGSKATYDSEVSFGASPEKEAVNSNGTFDKNVEVQERKIIRTVRVSVQTKAFDDFTAAIEERVQALGGYIQESERRGNSYGDTNSFRFATYTLRIPCKQDEVMLDFLAENGNITQRSVSTDDATLKYVDVESRLSALQSEKESLEKMLEQATAVDQIITIRSQLTEVIYQIESYQSQLRSLDNLVDYTTIYVTINEVEVLAQKQEEESIWQEIGNNLVYGFQRVWYFLQRLFVWLISALPYLLLIAAPGVVVLVILLIRFKRKKK